MFQFAFEKALFTLNAAPHKRALLQLPPQRRNTAADEDPLAPDISIKALSPFL